MNAQQEIEAGPLVAALGALVLLASLFLDWFDAFSAWTAFEVLDLVLAALALAVLAAAGARLGLPRWVPSRALPLLGAAAFVVIAVQLLSHPPVGIDRDTEIGAWLGFGGSVAMLVGGLVAVARVSLAVSVNNRYEPPPPAPAAPPPAPATPEPAPPPGEATHKLEE